MKNNISNNFLEEIEKLYPQQDNNKIFESGREGYWSNLSKKENDKFEEILKNEGTKKAVKSVIPQFEDMIYSEKREAALELLNHKRQGVCIDFGCMWGVLSVGMAKRGHEVISIDQTYQSLLFLRKRAEEDNLTNIHIVQDDIKETKFSNIADFAIVNGVLEWIPILEEVEVKEFYGKGVDSVVDGIETPKSLQKKFLKTVYESLKKEGKMVLAIENRHSHQYYMGRRDPHANLLFTTFLPRPLSNLISKFFHNKPYRNYIYSFREMEHIVRNAGFKACETYMCFPDYHFPELILPYSKEGVLKYRKYPNENRITFKQKLSYYFEFLIMKFLKGRFFAPAIIIVAKK